MSYSINYTDPNKGQITIEDGTIDQTTTLRIPGRNVTSYGTIVGENFLQMLENFASDTAPSNPVEGQLWYDTTDSVNELKLYDGTSWVNAGGIKKGENEPDVSTALPGDLWSDTDNNQLYLFTGSGWILVGPEFSDGLLTGTKPIVLTGTDDVDYTVLQIEVEGTPIAIYSSKSFAPKTTIQGLETIRPGLNLTTRNISGDGVAKFYGISEKAENLIVGNSSIAASNFLRSDVTSISNESLIIRNNTGLQVGQDGLINIAIEGTTGVISNLTSGSSINFRVNNLGTTKTPFTIDSSERVGVNNTSPAEALDVTGNIQSSGSITTNSTTQSSSISSGSFVARGGAGIAKNLYVGGDINVAGTITTADVVPSLNGVNTLGTSDKTYAAVHATNFYGNLVGNITGTVSGRSGSTNKLAQATTFQLTGDVSSQAIVFDGQQGGTVKTFVTQVADTFIEGKPEVATTNFDDEFIINRPAAQDREAGVFKVSRRNLLNAVTGTTPIGTVVSFAGDNAPDGWFLCDGSEVDIGTYRNLFDIIRYKFKDQGQTTSGKFAVPDLRGRFTLGADNMGGTSAGRVDNVNASVVGNSGGDETKTIALENLPEHEHDLKGQDQEQYYVIRDIGGELRSAKAKVYDAPTGTDGGQAYPLSGGVEKSFTDENGSLQTINELGVPLDVMNPFTTMNYIIYHGVGG